MNQKYANEQLFNALSMQEEVEVLGHGGRHIAVRLSEKTSAQRAEHLRAALAAGADPNARRAGGTPALCYAIDSEQTEHVRILLDAGADLEVRNHSLETPLVVSAARGRLEDVRLLLDRGADVNAAGGSYGETALIAAMRSGSSIEVSQLLLDRGADVNTRSCTGVTALMYAAKAGSPEHVQLLLDQGADPRAISDSGQGAADFARPWDEGILNLLRAAQEARDLNAALPSAHDDPMSRSARRAVGAREPEPVVAPARSNRPRL